MSLFRGTVHEKNSLTPDGLDISKTKGMHCKTNFNWSGEETGTNKAVLADEVPATF